MSIMFLNKNCQEIKSQAKKSLKKWLSEVFILCSEVLVCGMGGGHVISFITRESFCMGFSLGFFRGQNRSKVRHTKKK